MEKSIYSSNTANYSVEMSNIDLVWVISHDASLTQRLHEEINVIRAEYADDLLSKSPPPSVIVFDPDSHAREHSIRELSQLIEIVPNVPVLILSEQFDKELILAMVSKGANGYVLKSDPDARIHQALVDISNGGAPLNATVSKILINAFKPNAKAAADEYNLKDREVELLQLLSEGMTKKDISEKFNKSIHTIDNHVRQIYSKMRVNNLGEAVGEAFRAGVIS